MGDDLRASRGQLTGSLLGQQEPILAGQKEAGCDEDFLFSTLGHY